MPHKTRCDEHAHGLVLRDITQGGQKALAVCDWCGVVVEGQPKLWHILYRWVRGYWPWQADRAQSLESLEGQ